MTVKTETTRVDSPACEGTPVSRPSAPVVVTADQPVPVSRGAGSTLRRWVWHRLIRWGMLIYGLSCAVVEMIPRRKRVHPEGVHVLLTGTFYADTWITSHVRPLAASRACRRLTLVSTYAVPPTEGVEVVAPPGWLIRMVGKVPARLLCFAWVAVRCRPDVVGGFHLLVNGLLAHPLARLVGGRSLYFCVGGPMEVLGGGVTAENRIFGKMQTPDAVVERRLMRAVRRFDQVVTMGTRAVTYHQERGARNAFHVVPGGIDTSVFFPDGDAKEYDLVLVGRLVPVKRVDVFLDAFAALVKRVPEVRAVVVGDGELQAELEAQAHRLGVDGHVTFVGRRKDVPDFLRRSRVFVLTSDSEGLALSLMEAMSCGLPCVVSEVGDLGDMVEDGANGYLVPPRRADVFADRLAGLLEDRKRLEAFSQAACDKARTVSLEATTHRWDTILPNLVDARSRATGGSGGTSTDGSARPDQPCSEPPDAGVTGRGTS